MQQLSNKILGHFNYEKKGVKNEGKDIQENKLHQKKNLSYVPK